MTPMNPAMVEMAAQARVVEMRRAAAKRSPDAGRHDAERARRTRAPAEGTVSIRPAAPRRAIGWFLISVGMRLALPRPNASGR
jgi:hypothetical protein